MLIPKSMVDEEWLREAFVWDPKFELRQAAFMELGEVEVDLDVPEDDEGVEGVEGDVV